MREIKFRGMDKDGKWYIGDLIHRPFISIVVDGTNYNVNPETVGQFTEIKDCYEKEIFENDKIKVAIENDSFVAEVVFHNCSWMAKQTDGSQSYFYYLSFLEDEGRIEIIDNIQHEVKETEMKCLFCGKKYIQKNSDAKRRESYCCQECEDCNAELQSMGRHDAKD